MFFYDLHEHTNESIGEDSLEDMAARAKALGMAGIGIARYFGAGNPASKKEDIDIVDVVIIKPNTADELASLAEKARKEAEVVMVHGGNYDINRAACENSLVDVLCHPELGRKDSGLDHVCARAAEENNVAIEINFREVLESYKRHRVHILSSMKRNIRLCRKYGASTVITSAAVSKWGLRGGRELASLANILGMDLVDAVASVTTVPEEIVKGNRKKLEGKKWEGVEVEE